MPKKPSPFTILGLVSAIMLVTLPALGQQATSLSAPAANQAASTLLPI